MKSLCTTLVLVAVGAGCGLNESGNLSSAITGDVSNLAERRSPNEDLRQACGSGVATDAGAKTLKRAPYLQQLSTDSVTIGWVTTQPDGATVSITVPGGENKTTAAGSVDDAKVRTAGENQMWASVDGLEPATVYCYSISDATGAVTEPTGFRTAPAADSLAPVRFIAFGDSGSGDSDQYALLEQMFTVPYDLMVHTGDIAYDNGTIAQFEDNVFGVYAELLRNIPLFPSSGNHDYETLQGAPFRAVFNLPGHEKWYSFDYGRVHFAALDTEVDYATQAKWLDEDLAKTDRPWKIVFMHRPPYSSGDHGSDTSLRRVLEPVFERHGVQLVLAGHDHNYERIKPQKGTYYLVTGGGGRGTRPVGNSSFTEVAEEVIHFVSGEVFEDKLVLHAIDASGREFDSVVIPREPAR